LLDPEKQRWFAVEVVKQLRAHGYESYWAGGCVRDELLDRLPKDYDVATAALPAQIREVFGKRKTLPIGAAFGVITVLGPKGAGQIDVATFREDVAYSDGRRPDEVRFSSPQADALRRDFTINGMFYDPLSQQVIDFVGGREDLGRRVIRAIGNARERFTEDKLRMLRAVRFAAAYDFALEEQTVAAVREMAAKITVVSAERIAAEMRQMLAGPARARAVELLQETGLLSQILPEAAAAESLQPRLQLLAALDRPSFPQAFAVLLGWPHGEELVAAVAERWRLSNKELNLALWLLAHGKALDNAAQQPWSRLQPLLVHSGAGELVALYQTAAKLTRAAQSDVDFCRQKLALPRVQLDPPPLVTGEDLLAMGVPRGKLYSVLLSVARAAQLDGVIGTSLEAKSFVQERWRCLNQERSQ
jgi:tRNA nucleotidyltransferase/poly(A) polymerase